MAYGINSGAVTIAKQKKNIMKSLLTKKRLADAKRKAQKLGMGHPVKRDNAVTQKAGRRGCGYSRGR